MKFGTVDVNTKDVDYSTWLYKDFLTLYDSALKGNVTESPEEIAKILGVKVPVQKPKPETV